jgi:hypothetical protein
MSRKERAIEFILKNFGPMTAKHLDLLDEKKCLEIARKKVTGFLGKEKLQEFEEWMGKP